MAITLPITTARKTAHFLVVCYFFMAGCGHSTPGLELDSDSKVAARSEGALRGVDDVHTTVNDTKHDFGVLEPGQSVTHIFSYRNTSNHSLTVAQVLTPCACTVTRTNTSCIRPGENLELEVVFRAPSGNRNERKRIGVQFTEAEAPYLEFELSALVRPPISANPSTVSLGRLARGHRVTASFDLSDYTSAVSS